MPISNTEIAQKISDLVDKWHLREDEMVNWLAGIVNGGVALDGKYPLTNILGVVTQVTCPAHLASSVSSLVSGAAGYATNASNSATAAALSAADAALSATSATSSKNAAAASESSALNSKNTSANHEANCLVYKNDAAASQTAAAASASSALASKNAADTSETNAAASATSATSSKNAAATSETNAASSATSALSSKNAAATSETNAASSATSALSSKNAAATSETNALASKNAAATSETNAAGSATSAASSFLSLDNRYLGAKASEPTLDNHGNALTAGALFWHTGVGLKGWSGTAWVSLPATLASAVVNTPAGNLAATTVQAALDELDAEKLAVSRILGTVSQSGGVPTGALIEKGSNANGDYVRYADGTQICWFNSGNISVLTPGTYYSATGSFPATFSSTPKCIGSIQSYGVGPTSSFFKIGATSASGWSVTGTTNISDTVSLHITATGRWF